VSVVSNGWKARGTLMWPRSNVGGATTFRLLHKWCQLWQLENSFTNVLHHHHVWSAAQYITLHLSKKRYSTSDTLQQRQNGWPMNECKQSNSIWIVIFSSGGSSPENPGGLALPLGSGAGPSVGLADSVNSSVPIDL